MDIQALLGVEIVDEKEQQKKFLRNRISQSIKFKPSNFLNFPTAHDIPVLSSQSIHELASKLSTEVRDKNQLFARQDDSIDQETVAKAHIKLNFLRFLNNNEMKCNDLRIKKAKERQSSLQNKDSDLQKHRRIPDLEESKKAKKSTSSKQSFGLTNTVLFKQTSSVSARNAGGISIYDKEQFNQSIDQLMEEALLDNNDSFSSYDASDEMRMMERTGDGGSASDTGVSSQLPSRINQPVAISTGNSSSSSSSSSSSRGGGETISSSSTERSKNGHDDRERRRKQPRKASRQDPAPNTMSESGSNSSSSSSSTGVIAADESSIQCPLCMDTFVVKSVRVNSYMDKHVERCLRRQQEQQQTRQRESSASRSSRSGSRNQGGRRRYDEDMEWDEEDESEEEGEKEDKVAVAPRRGKRRKVAAEDSRGSNVKSPYVIGEDGEFSEEEGSREGAFSENSNDDHDDDYDDEEEKQDVDDDDDEEEGEFCEEEADVLDNGGVGNTRAGGEGRKRTASSMRRTRGSKAKSEDVKVVDDWEEYQYSKRIEDYNQEVVQYELLRHDADERMRNEDAPILLNNRDENEQDLEDGEEVEVQQDMVDRNFHQLGEVTPIQTSPSAEQKALNRAYLEEGLVATEFGSAVDKRSWDSLYPYQKKGVEWFWRHYKEDGSGGILGDEMGLGKSAQLCVHFGSIAKFENSAQLEKRQRVLYQNRHRRNTHLPPLVYPLMLVVCPATVLQHWLDEFHHWAPCLRVVLLHSISESFSDLQDLGDQGIHRALNRIAKSRLATGRTHDDDKTGINDENLDANVDAHSGVVCITTYEGLRRLMPKVIDRIQWSAVCLDEGQKIRNPEADITEICKRLPCGHRLILSGTPIQNSLKELWSLFDFVFPGRLGTLFSFETEFSTPIRLGGYSNANKLQAEIAVRTATSLQHIIRPFLLRRRKEDVQNSVNLPTKTEQVLFCVLSPTQRAMYEEIIQSPEVERCIRRNYPAFGPIMALRKLCNHPILTHETNQSRKAKSRLEKQAVNPNALDTSNRTTSRSGGVISPAGDNVASNSDSGKIDWALSGKLLVLGKILPLWHREGHKVLVFCQMHSMLDLVETMLRDLDMTYLRMDGRTPVQKRQGIIRDFNTRPEIFVLLLTSRTGGVGISLTAANRVILVDPDFNPQTDIQARERAWRIGQKREVTIYRLITKGTIEEKIYQRQIFKVLLSNRILDNPTQKRFFSKSELKELFELDGAEGGAYQNNRRFIAEHPPTSDLPDAAEVNLNDRAPVATVQRNRDGSVNGRSTGGTDSGGDKDAEPASTTGTRDKRLLKALFNGEALSAVYDHDFFEGGSTGTNNPSGSRKRANYRDIHEENRLRELAKKAVDDAIKQLELSTSNARNPVTTSSVGAPKRGLGLNLGTSNKSRLAIPQNRDRESASVGIFSSVSGFGTSSTHHSGSGGGCGLHLSNHDTSASSSSAVLSNLRSLQGRRTNMTASADVGASGTSTSSKGLDAASILDRLQRIFKPIAGEKKRTALTTDEILSNFGDLPDEFAHIFREMLRRVAVFKNGKWRTAPSNM